MKYRLLAPHVLPNQIMLEAGTEVGDDTGYPWEFANGAPMPPSTQMEGLDDEAREEVRKLHDRLYGQAPAWDDPDKAEQRDALDQQAEEQRRLDAEAEPVSVQQDMEREFNDLNKDLPQPRAIMPGAARQPSHVATVAPTVGGDMTPSPGPATPKPPKEDDLRPENPNEDQYPKG